jgi:uncharacterized iron-regulated protein
MPLTGACDSPSPPPSATCGRPGLWLTPAQAGSQPADVSGLIGRLANQRVVLLGEHHDSAEDHRWQLQTLAQLQSRHPDMAIGFEMFPRRLQPVLDKWVAGGLSESQFLKAVDWSKVWNFDPKGYMPLFNFARMNRIPMLALNVDQSLVAAVAKQGWDAVPQSQKEGITKPAKPAPAYQSELHVIFEHHPARAAGEAAFPYFVQAQTVWDRAMAQGIADYLKQHPKALVVGIMGAGHVRDGYGVPYQLKDLGVDQVSDLLTWPMDESCGDITPGIADALYVINPLPANPPRLGVAMQMDPNGIRIAQVMAGSVAAQAGLQAGDLILEVAGRPAKDPEDLRQAVERQAPGTWLPLKIRRGFFELEVIARFPAAS